MVEKSDGNRDKIDKNPSCFTCFQVYLPCGPWACRRVRMRSCISPVSWMFPALSFVNIGPFCHVLCDLFADDLFCGLVKPETWRFRFLCFASNDEHYLNITRQASKSRSRITGSRTGRFRFRRRCLLARKMSTTFRSPSSRTCSSIWMWEYIYNLSLFWNHTSGRAVAVLHPRGHAPVDMSATQSVRLTRLTRRFVFRIYLTTNLKSCPEYTSLQITY